MIKMMKLTGKDFKEAIIHVVKNLKENKNIMTEMETMKRIKLNF